MALQEDGSEIKFSFALMKNFLSQLRHLFVNSKTLLFMGALAASYIIVEFSVFSTMMDYYAESKVVEDLPLSAILTNLQDGLSSLLFIFASLISEAYTGPVTMITICAAASIEGLMLIWISAYSKSSGALYAAILFLTIGKSGQTLLDSFLENKVGEILEARQEIAINDGRTGKQKEHDLIRIILTNTWILAPIVVGYVVILFTDFFNRDYDIIFRNSAVMMGGCYILFLFGSTKYRHEQVSDESNVGKIFRICKAACGRRRSDYPASENGYYWKGNVRTNLCYVYGKGVRLKPRVPRLFRWLDKAAILVPEVSPDTEERDGKVCSVKEVREVKSLVPMNYLCFSFFAYSLLVATGNTFFVAQASSMTTTNGYDISKLFLIKVAAGKVSRFICFLIMARLRSKRTTYSTSKTFVVTTSIIRIGFGMVCAVICCFVAWKMEFYRLYSLELKIEALYPQFILLGMTEALLEGG
ncbi:hypothetical protein ACSQ67_020467 [Phaseolus vulgaris]